MPQSKAKKEDTIKELRVLFNQKDYFQAEPGRSLEFSEQVKSDIEEIFTQGLHKSIIGWGASCKKAREDRGLTFAEVAHLLRVSHKTIQEQEKKNESTDVDPFYLEAFSLIYGQFPHELLGLSSSHFVCPFLSYENQYSKYCNVIMSNLYQETDPEKLSHLKVITKIAKLTNPMYELLINFLKNANFLDSAEKIKPLDDPKAEDHAWRNRLPEKILAEDMRNSPEYFRRYIFWDAVYVLEDLECHNPSRLLLLAQMATADAILVKFLKSVMIDANYPRDPKSLRKYSVDNLIFGTTVSEGKRTRGISL